MKPLSWVEIDTKALANNIKNLKKLLHGKSKLMAVVKGQAYGHGMLTIAKAAVNSGADWLGVFHLEEALELGNHGLDNPILVLGYIPLDDLSKAIQHGYHMTVSSIQTLNEAAKAADASGNQAKIHLKLECGTNRLGFSKTGLTQALQIIRSENSLSLQGAHTHFANIEDTTEHDYARYQLKAFEEMLSLMRAQGLVVPHPHTACTAAAILFPNTHFSMVRIGIGMYGMWPSKETFVSANLEDRQSVSLIPVMTWKTIVAQIKEVPKGEYIGYGCTYKTTRHTRIAVLPIGYANGYDRRLSNRSYVLINGMRAAVRGRICMNLAMADITDIPDVELENEVVLLGGQGQEFITAEQLAGWADTINYEVVTRADPHAVRIPV